MCLVYQVKTSCFFSIHHSLEKIPITGIRNILEEGENISWFFYCGEFSEDDDFFKPMHISHLENYLPEVIPY
ncbi:immunity protein Imm33 domain-containing protein [Acinetobacter baumannii]|uniref:immunity protein Imm33 domain-containing protein n=1 Tax=Acinetobacter baumannii TaxID=470 RepID=UPI003DA701AF